MALLELVDASKGFGSDVGRTEVLENINLTVEAGEFIASVVD